MKQIIASIKRWAKEKAQWVIYEANPIIALSITSTIVILLAILIVETGNYIHKSKCLNDENLRRWHSAICEEYQNDEWIEINPFKKTVIYYNDK